MSILIATAVAAVKAGAVDYLSKPADADDVVKALLAAGEAPEPPENPMSADRVRWEHIQRVYELCGHNVSETARRSSASVESMNEGSRRSKSGPEEVPGAW